MSYLTFDTALMAAAALLCMAGMALIASRVLRRSRQRRQREALQDAGLRLAFDACAPEGADLSLQPFRLGRMRAEGLDGDARRYD
jgi:hypothetical protein